ncbi:MAG: hypothetical protein IPG91_09750 [Ideonella sp.]|nr:hypothetical protein [Ideonella sp.]
MDDRARAAPRREATPHPLRTLVHLLVVAAGWIGFAWMWLLVARQPWESDRLVWLIVGSFIVAPLLTAAWVMHNRAIHRRKGERRAVTPVRQRYRRDWRGREVKADWAAMAVSPLVTIIIDEDGCKRFLGVSRSPPPKAPHRAERSPRTDPWMDTVQ